MIVYPKQNNWNLLIQLIKSTYHSFIIQIKQIPEQINLMGNQKSIIESCREFMQHEKNTQTISYGQNYSTAPIHPSDAPIHPSRQQKHRKIQITHSYLLQTPIEYSTINANRLAQLSLLMTDKITKSLDQLIMEKMQCNQHFQHGAIISLISCLMKVFQVCYVSDMPYSHFHSRHINYSSHFQLLNPRMISIPQNDHLTKQVFNKSPSPEIRSQAFSFKKNHQEIPVHIRHRNDLFAIGCIILEACTLTSLPITYDYDGSTMDADIEEKLRLCLDRYHPSISQFLSMIIKLKNREVCEQAIRFYEQRLSRLVIENQRESKIENKGELRITQSPTRKALPHFSYIRNTSRLKPVSVIPECSEASLSHQISKQISPKYLERIDSGDLSSKKEIDQQNILTSDDLIIDNYLI